ncbi:hypothetical protein F383_36474 [Gossypium arboreum]|uniref:Uncharacterized protein n=1 Tax=Gossypium arboreum TaxID=29729 RepID=A0A0B0MK04_GOSAR|nr:hypothetical protein F383_38203 [Gossypium arboreum]KHF99341.1 hypothetical protein F383_38371 [Gossypium arboreum]KHG11140.1 hypothetical protein F383_12884 [Gossypium arboreum]KHG16366.1 hypothetical protein F383_01881 [Gossypium arboreum]KHG17015.1 hypothetical protein F383_03002 [Gossypium arboreum]
MRHYMCRLL